MQTSQVSSEITGKQLRESFMKIREDVESRKPAQILKTVVNLFVKLVENIMYWIGWWWLCCSYVHSGDYYGHDGKTAPIQEQKKEIT